MCGAAVAVDLRLAQRSELEFHFGLELEVCLNLMPDKDFIIEELHRDIASFGGVIVAGSMCARQL